MKRTERRSWIPTIDGDVGKPFWKIALSTSLLPGKLKSDTKDLFDEGDTFPMDSPLVFLSL